jgi:hypothetical protein
VPDLQQQKGGQRGLQSIIWLRSIKRHLVALYTVWYNYVKQHKSLKGLSPAWQRGISDFGAWPTWRNDRREPAEAGTTRALQEATSGLTDGPSSIWGLETRRDIFVRPMRKLKLQENHSFRSQPSAGNTDPGVRHITHRLSFLR